MKLRRLGIDRLPGVDESFEVRDFGDGFNIVVGPNESGKSSLCRAARALWWTELGPTERLAVHALVDRDGESWRVEREGARHTWQREGEPAGPPPLPPPHLDRCFFLRLLDLLEEKAAAGDDVAAGIRKQMAGGFDLDEAMSTAVGDIKRNHGNAQRKKLNEADAAINRANRGQEELRGREDQLTDLEVRADAAASARQRQPHFETALELRRASSGRVEVERSLEQLPDGLQRLTGGEVEQLDQRERELESKRLKRIELDSAREEARTARSRTRLESALDASELAAWRARAEELSRVEQELNQAREDWQSKRSEWEAANRAVGARGDELSAIDLPTNDPPATDLDDHFDIFAFLRSAQSVEGQRAAIDERMNLLETVDPTTGEGPGIDRLRAGVEALRAWLRASPESPTRRVPMAAVAALVALVALGVLGAWLVNPLVIALAGIGIGVGLGLAAVARLARPAAEALAARKAAEHEFSRQGLAPISQWSEAAVDERLRDLESELAECSASAVRADRRANEISSLKTRRDALKPQIAVVEQQRFDLQKRLGVGEGLSNMDFVDVVRALDARRRCAEAERGAASRISVKEVRHAELLAGLSGYLSAHGESEPTDLASAQSGINALASRDDAYRMTRQKEEDADRSLEQLDQDVAEIREFIDRIFRSAGVAQGDRAGLSQRVESLDRYRELMSERDGFTRDIERAERKLDEMGESALAERDAESLQREADELGRRDEEFVGLQKQIQQIRAEVQQAREGHDLEELIADRSTALGALQEKRDEALLSRAGKFLIDAVRAEHETPQAPRVLERARELFGNFTDHGYQLIVPSDDAGSFRAIDAQSRASKSPDQLSDGTRAQLLLAVRLAFAEEAEQGTPLPFFLDEALDPSDPVRFEAVVRSLGRMVADEDRQFIYLTADPADVTRIQAALDAEGCKAAHVIDLARVRNQSVAVSRPGDLVVPPLPVIPAPGGRSPEEYGAALGVPTFDPARGYAAQHLFHLVWDDLDLLHQLLERRIQRVGQWQMASAAGSAIAEQLASATLVGGQLGARVDLLEDFCRLWSEGRGRPVDRDVLEASGAVSDTFFERVVEVASELDGNAESLIQAMRLRQDERLGGYRKQAAEKLEVFLKEEGHIDRRPILAEDEISPRMMASPAAARLPGDLAADCVYRWWVLSGS